jgi:hypothetical protein
MEAVCSSETSVILYPTTCLYPLDDKDLKARIKLRREILISLTPPNINSIEIRLIRKQNIKTYRHKVSPSCVHFMYLAVG